MCCLLLLLLWPVQVCLRGPVMYKGYYKQPDLTAEATDEDGFFHTGWGRAWSGC